jgi:hypothetical protein
MKLYKILIIIFIIVGIFSLTSCEKIQNYVGQRSELQDLAEELPIEEDTMDQIEEALDEVEEQVEVLVEEVIEDIEEEPVGCTTNDDCEWDEYCIDEICGKTGDIYDTDGDCEEKCNFNDVVITTSDGDEMTLSRGKGSYTAAGAIEWKLLSSSDYCLGDEDTVVAIKLIYKNAGTLLGEEIVTVDVGETSKVITHPVISSISFTLEVESINEECS